MREELGEVVFVNLLAEGVGWCCWKCLDRCLDREGRERTDKDILEEAGLRIGDVGKPTTHYGD